MKNLNIITVQPDAPMFQWTVAVQLYNARELGILKYFSVLVFKSYDEKHRPFNGKWKFLEKKFPEARFYYYEDTENVSQVMAALGYIPLLRPWTLKQHWLKYPELEKDAILYIDSDVVFTKHPNFLFKLKDDDIQYFSQAGEYTNATYFDSKRKDVILEELEKYKKVDVLDKAASYCGITRAICEKNNDKTGAAQYLLKNIDSQFWQDVFDSSSKIKVYLADINRRFFPSEDAGIQSWCSDIWALVWNLWKRELPTDTPEEMNFCWATNYIEEWDKNYIYHDASASPDPIKKDGKIFRTFFKRGNRIKILDQEFFDYTLSYEAPMLKTPFDEDLSYVSSELCSYNYCKIISDTKNYLFK